MFCNLCGKPLPEGFKYVVCDPCFAERRQEVIYSGLQRNIRYYEGPPGSAAGADRITFIPGVPGMSAGSGYQWDAYSNRWQMENCVAPGVVVHATFGGSGHVLVETREVIPSDDDYIFSARAEKVKKEIEEKKLIRKRMIRLEED
jgi:hypothetical protein